MNNLSSVSGWDYGVFAVILFGSVLIAVYNKFFNEVANKKDYLFVRDMSMLTMSFTMARIPIGIRALLGKYHEIIIIACLYLVTYISQ